MTKKKPKRGRPPQDPALNRSEAVNLRMTQDEKARIEAAATRDGKSVSDWARDCLLSSAK